MSADPESRRVLVVADHGPAPTLESLFACGPLAGWEPVPADGFAAARFVLQHHPCDLLLVDESVYRRDGADAFDWLAGRHHLATVVLSDTEVAVEACENPGNVWLPRGLVGARPELLAAALAQAERLGKMQRGHQQVTEALRQSRRQVDRLVGLLWRTLPQDADRRWLSQRHVLERLREEVTRAERYGNPLTVALGELQVEGEEAGGTAEQIDWVADQIARGKRCCDVAGQYGPHGFLLLLVNTPADGGVVCCRRLQRVLEQAKTPHGPHRSIRACFGLAAAAAGPTSQNLLRRAEEHLEAAKESGAERLVMG